MLALCLVVLEGGVEHLGKSGLGDIILCRAETSCHYHHLALLHCSPHTTLYLLGAVAYGCLLLDGDAYGI